MISKQKHRPHDYPTQPNNLHTKCWNFCYSAFGRDVKQKKKPFCFTWQPNYKGRRNKNKQFQRRPPNLSFWAVDQVNMIFYVLKICDITDIYNFEKIVFFYYIIIYWQQRRHIKFKKKSFFFC